MSVDFSASLGAGWIITEEERDSLIAAELISEDDPRRVNCYSNYDVEYFLGIICDEVDAGYSTAIIPDEIFNAIKEVTQRFPNLHETLNQDPEILMFCRIC